MSSALSRGRASANLCRRHSRGSTTGLRVAGQVADDHSSAACESSRGRSTASGGSSAGETARTDSGTASRRRAADRDGRIRGVCHARRTSGSGAGTCAGHIGTRTCVRHRREVVGQHGRLDLLACCSGSVAPGAGHLKRGSSAVLLGDWLDAAADPILFQRRSCSLLNQDQNPLSCWFLRSSSPERGRAIRTAGGADQLPSVPSCSASLNSGDRRDVSWSSQMDDKGVGAAGRSPCSAQTGSGAQRANLASKPPADFDLLPNDDRNDSDGPWTKTRACLGRTCRRLRAGGTRMGALRAWK